MKRQDVFSFTMINEVTMGVFRFKFGEMSIMQSALINTKLNAILEQTKDKKWPIGDFIYFIHKLNVPFELTYAKPNGVDDDMSKKLFNDEFMPLFEKCIKAGIIVVDYINEE